MFILVIKSISNYAFYVGLKSDRVSTLVFYIFVNPFLSRVKSSLVTRFGEHQIVRFVLNNSIILNEYSSKNIH